MCIRYALDEVAEGEKLRLAEGTRYRFLNSHHVPLALLLCDCEGRLFSLRAGLGCAHDTLMALGPPTLLIF